MKKGLRPRDLIECGCEACDVVVFRTTAKRVKVRPEREHLSMLQAYDKHKARSGKPCKAPPFSVILQAASVTTVSAPATTHTRKP